MIVDTSAIACVLRGEASADAVMELLLSGDPLRMSAGTASELHIVTTRWIEPVARRAVDAAIVALGIEMVPYDLPQLEAFKRGFAAYGRGGHNTSPAKLNFGDCFAYALAKVTGEPLLFVGDDFRHTDIIPALALDGSAPPIPES